MVATRDIQDVIANCDTVELTDSRSLYGGSAAMPLLVVQGAVARSIIALQGAQLLSHKTKAGDCLWLSDKCLFEPGKPIRGGVPLCLPWFGPHPEGDVLPKHGLARLKEWRLDMAHSDGFETRLRFCTEFDKGPGVASELVVQCEMRLTESVTITLQIVNVGRTKVPVSFAFHSYLAVDDASQAEVDNLQSCEYLDNTDGLSVKLQMQRVSFGGEVDRVFQGVVGSQWLLSDSVIRIAGQGCPSVIVWNPGPELGLSMEDVGDGWRQFICVERGAAFKDTLSLLPGASHLSQMSIIRDA